MMMTDEVSFSTTKKDYTNEAYVSDNLENHNPNNQKSEKPVANGDIVDEIEVEGNIRRDRPYSASMVSRKSVTSTRSHASLSSRAWTSEYGSAKMFSYKEGCFARAVEQCKQLLLNDQVDGEFKGSWLLTEIDHWDFEMEKLVLLTAVNLYLVKFDFIKMIIRETRKIPLELIKQVQIADLKYPNVSLMPMRDQGGIRLHLGSASIFQIWNPFCKSLPMITLTHHALIYHKNENETVTYNADDFSESIVIELERIYEKKGVELDMKDDPIVINSYASLYSLIYNQSKLGFNLDRGGINY